MIKVITVLGTRPEIIRLSRVIDILDKYLKHIIVNTEQNSDYNLNGIFFKELGLREPDYHLQINNTTLGNCLSDVFIKTEKIFKEEKPDAILILGDTNSSLTSLIAKRMNIPIYHMEAGNRSFDLNVPEEINRKVVDHIADFNLVYTEHARRNLISEGISSRYIYLTGSPLSEVLDFYKNEIDSSNILQNLEIKENDYFVASIHREENTDNLERLKEIILTLTKISKHFKKEVILSIHPRTKNRLEKSSLSKNLSNLRVLTPFGYFDYVKLQKNAFCTISDSGTISEESAILNFPALTLRHSIERPEALDTGSITLVDENFDRVKDAIKIVVMKKTEIAFESDIPFEYSIKNTSQRVLNLIMSTSSLSNEWLNRSKICRSDWD